ncbi:MAG: hypothetical protein HQL69_17180, partial [Magnetococcales bacterium]|nr:hypothetical protein [Magnetococcales bacterium]
NNALQKIKIIRSLDKNSDVAKKLQVNVAQKYASLAGFYLNRDFTKGKSMLAKANELAPNDPTVSRINELYKLQTTNKDPN